MTSLSHPDRTIPRETVLAAGVAATLAAALAWFGPPGSDFAAHLYQSTVFEDRGFGIWNNFWYAGRYSFVTYSLLYYPLAALVGIKLLAVLSIGTAALAFGVVATREWGTDARWAIRSFAVVWAGVVLSGAFPFALGMALALLSLWALQTGRSRPVRAPDASSSSQQAPWRSCCSPSSSQASRWPDRRAVPSSRCRSRSSRSPRRRSSSCSASSPQAVGTRSLWPSSPRHASSVGSGSSSRGAYRRRVSSAGCTSSTSLRARRPISFPRGSARTSRGCDTRRSRSRS